MKIYTPDVVGKVSNRDTEAGVATPVVMHSHANKSVLDKISISETGELLYDSKALGSKPSNEEVLSKLSVTQGRLVYNGQPVDTVGHEFVNSVVLDQFSVVDGILMFNGQPVDTTGHVFSNVSVLDLFTSDGSGGVLFNGQPISGTGGTSLPNADILSKFSLDEDGTTLLFNGSTLSGATGSISLSVTNAGTGVNVIKGFVGNDLQAKTFKAGSNVTFDVTSDEIQINATLGGAVSASTTFKASDAYTVAVSVVSNTANTKLVVDELSVSANTKLLFPFNTSVNSELVTATSTSTSSNVTIVTNAYKMRGGVCAQFGGGTWGGIATNSAQRANLNATIPGTGNFTIEFEIIAGIQEYYAQIFGCYAGGGASTSDTFSIMLSSAFSGIDTIYTYSVSGTTTQPSVSSSGICDGNKHHVAIVRNSGTLYLYVDGVLKSSVAYTGSLNKNTTAWNFGCSGAGGNPFVGSLRSFAVYNYAKYTAAFTPLAFYATAKVSTNTLDMAGKYLSSVFWKTISSMSVASTETASAYLLWMLRTGDGLVWYWDNTNKVFVADSAANIMTKGVTTSVLTSALTNYGWNYKSDTIGFVVAFVTTDGSSTPILTSLTLNAVQSADKTAGHALINSSGSAVAQRSNLKVVGASIQDDSTNNQTILTVTTDTSGMTHGGSSLQTVVNSLQAGNQTIGGKVVDLTNVTQGSVPVYDQASSQFKMGAQAIGGAGNGLFRTSPIALAVGAEVTVTHQMVNDGRAVYQADQVIAGDANSSANRMFNSYDKTLTGVIDDSFYLTRDVVKLPTSYSASAMTTVSPFPIPFTSGVAYIVDDYVYCIPSVGANWSGINAIYKAHVSTPNSWTLVGSSPTFAWPINQQVYRYGNTLFMYTGGSFATADVSAPAAWTVTASNGGPAYNSAAGFLVGSMLYFVGGWGTAYLNTIYSIDLSKGFNSAWTKSANVLPALTGRCIGYQYGNYLYILGGENTLDSVYSNRVLRASVSDPTTWAQVGTLPIAASTLGVAVSDGKVFIVGGRSGAAAISNVYMSDASNPISWTALTSLPEARSWPTILTTSDGFYVIGGIGNSVAAPYNTIYKYTITKSTVGSGTVVLNQLNTSLMQSMNSIQVIANMPVSTTIQTAINFEGTWKYWNGTAWTDATSQAAALTAGASLVPTATANEFTIAGASALPLSSQYIQVAFLLSTSVTTATPELYRVTYNYQGKDTYSPLLITSYSNSYGEIGLLHKQGSYQTTNIKNKTASALTVVLKVYDGYGTGA